MGTLENDSDLLPASNLRLPSAATKLELDVSIGPNADHEEALQEHRASRPTLRRNTEFDHDLEIQGMNQEMQSLREFEVYGLTPLGRSRFGTSKPSNFHKVGEQA